MSPEEVGSPGTGRRFPERSEPEIPERSEPSDLKLLYININWASISEPDPFNLVQAVFWGDFASTLFQFSKFTLVFYSTFLTWVSPLSAKMLTFFFDLQRVLAKCLLFYTKSRFYCYLQCFLNKIDLNFEIFNEKPMKNLRKPEVFHIFLCFRALDIVCQKWSWGAEAGKWSLLVKSLIRNWSFPGREDFFRFLGGVGGLNFSEKNKKFQTFWKSLFSY